MLVGGVVYFFCGFGVVCPICIGLFGGVFRGVFVWVVIPAIIIGFWW